MRLSGLRAIFLENIIDAIIHKGLSPPRGLKPVLDDSIVVGNRPPIIPKLFNHSDISQKEIRGS